MKNISLILSVFLTLAACTPNKPTPEITLKSEPNLEPTKPAEPEMETVDYFSGKNGSLEGFTCPSIVVPGVGIGSIVLNMPKGNLLQSGLKIKQFKNSTEDFLVGPFLVTLANDKVVQIEAEPAFIQCLEYAGKPIPANSTIEQLQKIFPHCKKLESRRGGNVSACDKIEIRQGGLATNSPLISISSPQQ